MFANDIDFQEFGKKIKDELRVFQNFTAILDKVDNDGYVKKITESLNEIFKNEVGFAIKGTLNRTSKAQRKEESSQYKEAYRDQYLHIQGEFEAYNKLLHRPDVWIPHSV